MLKNSAQRVRVNAVGHRVTGLAHGDEIDARADFENPLGKTARGGETEDAPEKEELILE